MKFTFPSQIHAQPLQEDEDQAGLSQDTQYLHSFLHWQAGLKGRLGSLGWSAALAGTVRQGGVVSRVGWQAKLGGGQLEGELECLLWWLARWGNRPGGCRAMDILAKIRDL